MSKIPRLRNNSP